MAVNKGSIITIAQLDALYTRLYNLTNTHKNSPYQLNKTNIADAQQTSGLKSGDIIKTTTAKIDLLKQELKNLANSKWYKDNTYNQIVTMTDFSGNFSIPDVGDLITAEDFNLIDTTISSAESITPHYANNYSQYTNYTNYANYGAQYSNYSQYTNYSKYQGKYSNYSNYTKAAQV